MGFCRYFIWFYIFGAIVKVFHVSLYVIVLARYLFLYVFYVVFQAFFFVVVVAFTPISRGFYHCHVFLRWRRVTCAWMKPATKAHSKSMVTPHTSHTIYHIAHFIPDASRVTYHTLHTYQIPHITCLRKHAHTGLVQRVYTHDMITHLSLQWERSYHMSIYGRGVIICPYTYTTMSDLVCVTPGVK